MTPTVMTIYGTRPEAIKVAPVLKALDATDTLTSVAVVTGQHRHMLDQVNTLFGLTPDEDLDVFAHGQSLSVLAAKTLDRLDPVLTRWAPDAVMVQGDTTTAMVAALAAFHGRIPVVHLEAGLRTGNLHSPFPEEANRRVISRLASLHLAPTARARNHLLAEQVPPDSIVVTGNTVIDALLDVVSRDVPFSDARLHNLESSGRTVILVTVHRRESWGEPLARVARAVRAIAQQFPQVTLVLPLHLNPLVREVVLPVVDALPNVLTFDPLPYADFARLMRLSRLVLTDSGGVQEEAPSLGKPVLVLRENTERPEAVEAGTVALVGTEDTRIVSETRRLLTHLDDYALMANAVNPYGDGAAAGRVVAAIEAMLGVGARRADFSAGHSGHPAPANPHSPSVTGEA